MALPNGTGFPFTTLPNPCQVHKSKHALKHSSLSSRLMRCLGRSAASCRNQFNLLTNRLSSVLAPGLPGQPSVTPKPKKKRPSSGPGHIVPADTSIQPQQYQFAPINEPGNPIAFQGLPPAQGESPERPSKKRGRPSKAERELREAEAAARGEVYQPTKRKKYTPRGSTEGAGAEAPAEGEATADPRKKVRNQKSAPVTPMRPPMEIPALGEFGYQTAVGPGEQMQIATPGRPVRSTIPETQTSEYPATESLLAGMREHAGLPGAPGIRGPSQMETAHSSATLQHGYASVDQPGAPYPPPSQG
ncbi:MAG: hypothetical protein Q9163_004425 [Psora crenata]